MYKIGLLLPRSTYYSAIGFDMHEGFRSGLEALGRNDISIISENIGYGTDQQHCYRVVEKLLIQDNVSVIFAYISHRTAQLLRPLFLASNKTLVVLDSGANLPQEWPQSPNVCYLSLQDSLGCMLMGQFASKKNFTKTAVATGYYDGGYLHTLATSFGCQNSGISILFNQATSYKREEFTMAPLKQFMSEHPDVYISTMFSADFVQWYFEEIAIHFPDKSLPIYLSPFALEETMLKDAKLPSVNCYGIASWSEKLDNTGNKLFLERIQEAGRVPNLFSLLGWEGAILCDHITKLIDTHKSNGKQICQSLLDFRYNGPRGETFFNKEMQTTISPMYHVRLIETEDNGCALGEFSNISTEKLNDSFVALYSQELNNAISGWFNSYTCI